MAASPVHWQSAFWAIAAVALNNVAQRGGDVCGNPKRYRAGLASSPFFCLADMLPTYLQIGLEWRNVSLRDAVRRVAKRRHQHEAEEDDGGEGEGGASWIQWFVLRILIPVMALLQAVKILAFRGLPWTQAFSVVYILAFFTEEGLSRFGRPLSTDYPADFEAATPASTAVTEKALARLYRIAAWLQFGCWIWILQQLYSAECIDEVLVDCIAKHPLTAWVTMIPWSVVAVVPLIPVTLLYSFTGLVDVLISLIPSAILFMVCYALATSKRGSGIVMIISSELAMDPKTLMMISIVAFVSVLLYLQYSWRAPWFLASSVHAWHPFDLVKNTMDELFRLAFRSTKAFFLLGFILVISWVVLRALFVGRFAQRFAVIRAEADYKSLCVSVVCLFANFITALVYFSQVYDENGTSKPSWTGNIGRL